VISYQSKIAISEAVFGLGVLGGLFGCFASAGSVFTIGANDSTPEVFAIIFALATPLPACLVALWKRLMPGIWLIFAGCFFPYGMLAQRAYMIKIGHLIDQPTVSQTIGFCLPYTLVLAAFGTFAVVTHLLKWPEVFGSSNSR